MLAVGEKQMKPLLAAARTMLAPLVAAMALAVLVPAAHARPASPRPDAALLKAATAEAPALTNTLQALVEIETGTGDAEGMAAMGRLLETRFTALGGTTERMKPLGDTVGDIIVARWRGSGRGRILLIAHMDTVYQRGALARAPFKLVGSSNGPLAYGPGVADDKGGVALILHTLTLLSPRDYAELTVAINTDEERGSLGSGPIITQLSQGQSAVLSFEPTSYPEALPNGTSGTNTVIVTIKGKAAHAGAAPESGINALAEAAHIIAATRDLDQGPGKLRFNWTVMNQENGVRNIIPDNVTLIGDLRITDMSEFEPFKQALAHRLAAPSQPGAIVTHQVRLNRPPFNVTPASMALIEEAQATYARLGRKLRLLPRTGGGTDAAFAALAGVPVLEALGLPGAGYHTTDAEYVYLAAVPNRLYLAASLIRRLGR
jgi:glutamate carboxypeptidase